MTPTRRSNYISDNKWAGNIDNIQHSIVLIFFPEVYQSEEQIL